MVAAGFVSWGGLTQSPADILFTALTVVGLAACLAYVVFRSPREFRQRPLTLGRTAVLVAATGLGAGTGLALNEFARRVVFNSNLSLLRWDFDLSRLLLQLSLFLVLVAALLVLATAFRAAFRPDDHVGIASDDCEQCCDEDGEYEEVEDTDADDADKEQGEEIGDDEEEYEEATEYIDDDEYNDAKN